MTDEQKNETPEITEDGKKTWIEDIEVASRDAVGRVQDLIEEGNVRRLIILKEDDSVLLEIPLTIGVGVGAGTVLMAPALAAIGAVVAFMAKIKLRVVRVEDSE